MCKCQATVNENLKRHNARIAYGFLLSREGPPTREMELSPPMIIVEKIDKRKRGKTPTVFAGHCPFCGEKLGIGND